MKKTSIVSLDEFYALSTKLPIHQYAEASLTCVSGSHFASASALHQPCARLQTACALMLWSAAAQERINATTPMSAKALLSGGAFAAVCAAAYGAWPARTAKPGLLSQHRCLLLAQLSIGDG